MRNTMIFLTYFLYVCLLLALAKFLKRVCWTPFLLQYKLKKQGIKGPSYKFLHGNIKEISAMRKQSMAKTIPGLFHNIFPKILPHVHTWTNLYGKNYLNWQGSQAELVVTQVELVEEILSNKEGFYPKLCLKGYAKKLLGDGLSSSEGEKWTKMRKLSNHVFHADSLKSMIPAMIKSSEVMLEKWKNYEGEEIEVFQEFRVLTSEVISKTAFGSSYLEGKNMFDMLMHLTLLVSRNIHKIRFPLIR
ncbi:cytochrome P450 CYP749A22-like [Impatiens glandulifera]|uniref:cytochrome P450 CYP749A22-like n=1 Tax=Impatiens glandulifera TaxID=253017 RepID=UPI001FB08B97|nr:cytochrome P450 CYP749A22-like [Impatiens glandulifera]